MDFGFAPEATSASTSPEAGLVVWKYSLPATFFPLIQWLIFSFCSLLTDNSVYQTAYALHFHHHFIARYHVGQPLRRAGGNHVARLQGHEIAQIRNQEWDAENEIGGGAFLTQFTVNVGAKTKVVRVRDGFFWHHVRADGVSPSRLFTRRFGR